MDPVDTIDAGDAFTAGCIAGFVEGRPLRKVAEFANAVAAAATTAVGAIEGLPTRAAVSALRERTAD
ncbi:PfkB family carbohydrate kinase [Halogranum rubrum]|uniref:PfkB family carbohydrate kinase n=1 Tax=Halogranum rubrum TaxID=553466 RepID=UPI0006777BCF|nr:PfkB family carbohydrate kinase [Halogranum salarium]